MSVNIKQLDGTLKKVAGSTILLDGTCSEIQNGTITASDIGTVNAGAARVITITLPVAFPDANYAIIFPDSTNAAFNVTSQKVTATGFEIVFRNILGIDFTASMDCTWYAFRLVELEGYNAIYNKMTNIDTEPTENSTNLVTSGGVYDAIKNASSIFIGTSSEWESETAKSDFQLAIITDQPTVNAVDSTDGSTTVVGEPNKRWCGTAEEWEQFKTDHPDKVLEYDIVCISNDMDTGEVVDAVTDGDMRAVTSNAVYDAMNVIQSGTGTRNASYVSSDVFYCTWYKVGRICTVNIQYSLSQLTPSNVDIITGLPKPVDEIASVGEGLNNTNASGFVIKKDGNVRTHYDGASGQFVHGTATYITVD